MRSGLKTRFFAGAALLCLSAMPVMAATQGDSSSASGAQKPVRVAAATTSTTTTPVRVAAAEGPKTIETVVVTAEKRAESSQNVPIALTAINGDDLDSHGVTAFQDLSHRIPSLRFGNGVTGGENVITMRGLGSVNTTPGGDSPVAYSVDGVYLQRSTSVDPEFFDIDRIEVLRGPQGTLYGRNSVGGTINVVTNRPTDTLAASVDALVGDYDARTFRGWVNVPLVDDGAVKVYARLSAVSSYHSPYSTNLSAAPTATHNQNAQNLYMLRGQLYFEFGSDVNFLVTASTVDNFDPVSPTTAWWETPTRFITGPDAIAIGSPCDFSTQAKYRARVFCHDAPEKAFNKVTLYSGTLNWDLGFAELTSVSGYSTSNVSQTSDGDGSEVPMALGSSWKLRQQQLSEEVRLASNNDASPFKWIAGFYYFWADNFEDFAYMDLGTNDTFPFPGALDEFNFLSHGHTKTRSYAPFGQVDIDLAKTDIAIPLTVTLGARYSDDEKYGTSFLDYQLPVLCGGTCSLIPNVPFSRTWGQWTGKGGLKYQINDDVIAYASASRGYVAGGNIIGLLSIYNPESMWSYESGVKSTFLDNRLQLNVSAYHEEITHLQVFIQSGTASVLNNVPGLTQANGIETEVTAIPIENLQLNAALTLTHATYGDYPVSYNSRFAATSGATNFKGNWLNQTPPYTLELGAEYAFQTSFGTITPRVDTFFSGRVQFLPDNFFTSTQHAYHQTDIHLSWTDLDGRYRFEAFVRNLENATVISNDGLQSISLGQQVQEPDNFAYYPPRTFGVRFGVNL